ncbi:hypothetical protein chiPu_0004863 [Chiloscyllium punctatum]|uniref:Uncharacterized protein n=1 Tax=Chiloscyllium punctatum TaxID=137246 RepID=A0A401S7U1_CHIPU|nr:hypothetical protein [Chiloscyllium punctatum]
MRVGSGRILKQMVKQLIVTEDERKGQKECHVKREDHLHHGAGGRGAGAGTRGAAEVTLSLSPVCRGRWDFGRESFSHRPGDWVFPLCPRCGFNP